MFSWYAINTYSGHENKVKQNLEHRIVSMNQKGMIRRIVIPTETVTEMKDNQKIEKEVRTMPGYLLVNMELNEDSWGVVKGTPGVTGFVGSQTNPVPLAQSEIDRLLVNVDVQASTASSTGGGGATSRQQPAAAQFSIGETVKVVSGPLSDFSGEIAEINADAHKLKVLVSIFGRETPVEVGYDQVKKVS